MAEKITTISPSTNKPIVERNGPTDAEFQQIPKTAHQAFLKYRQTSLADRKQIVAKALQNITARQDELAREITEQMGRPIGYPLKEVNTAVSRCEYLLKIADKAFEDTPGEPQEGFNRYVRKVPLGPVLILFPWNYPYLTLVNSLIPALLSGNSVILKPSPQTPLIAERMQEVFVQAGLDKDV
ncbi:ALDH-like protein, partial [Hortaea werneckii]